MSKKISSEQSRELLHNLGARFEKNKTRHPHTDWHEVEKVLKSKPEKLWSLHQMEMTGGEPDIVELSGRGGEIIFVDCSTESPAGRRSLCYDAAALASRKENKPRHSALGMAGEMGVEILNEEDYRRLQSFGKLDTKTSSWLETPDAIRTLGGAIFGDFRYNQVFIYHNGAESYYAARGFRAKLRL